MALSDCLYVRAGPPGKLNRLELPSWGSPESSMPLIRFSLALVFSLFCGLVTLSAEPKSSVVAEIDRGILELLPQAEGNFPKIKPLIEAARAPAWVVHTATPVPALHANVYMVKTIIETHRRL